jgi:predicted ATPase
MRILRVKLERFKRFKNYELDLNVASAIPDVILLIGDNGSGKTTILQAIAATLGTATTQLDSPLNLDWAGFDVKGISANHRGVSEVHLDIEFDSEELAATQEFFEKSDFATLPNAATPEREEHLTLIWDNHKDRNNSVSTDPSGARYYFQFQGRRYAYDLLYNRRAEENMFKRIGGVFWYTEQRTSHSLTPLPQRQYEGNGKLPIKQVTDDDSMRRLFTRWFASSTSKVDTFNKYYSYLFPERKLTRIMESYGTETQVLFSDGTFDYEVAELSGGERALMPILLDFVEWDINHSVVLIDELELHLHPPLQQAFLTLLPDLGQNNQFIITTHSDSVASLVEPESIKRVSELHEYSN